MKLLATLAVLVAATIGSASATVIQYNTVGSAFTTPQTGSSLVFNNGLGSAATITYTPVVGGSFDDGGAGTNISYGFFTTSFTGTDASIAIPAFTFNLIVNETGPSPSTRTVAASSPGGSISQNTNNVNVSYVPTTFSLPSAAAVVKTNFTIFTPTPLVPPTTNAGVATVQGFAVGSSVPEPGSLVLLGAGLIGLGFTARKKFTSRS